jgi:hypothetical protein
MTKRLVKANGRTVCRAAVVGGLVLSLALFLGACENPSGGGDDGPSAQELAVEFRAAHSEILELLTARAALSDEAAIDAALEAYEALSDEVKAELTAEKAKLDGLKARMNSRWASAVGLRSYLEGLPDNTVYNPYALAYTGRESPAAIYNAIGAAGKYVALDLSKSLVTGFEYDLEEGRKLVVELVLPDSLEKIEDQSAGTSPFGGFTSLKSVRAPGMVELGNYAFYQCTSLETVTLDAATNIGSDAFSGCTSLETVSLNAATEIGERAFDRCNSLKAVTLDKVVTIGPWAFYYCTSLETVSLNAATEIGQATFSGCTSLKTVSLNAAAEIRENAFLNCAKLSAISLPEAVSIGKAFYGCSGLPAISLPKAVFIDSLAFYDCRNLTAVTLPEAASIGSQAFSGCISLSTVTLPKAETIGNSTFQKCTSLTTVILGETPPSLGTIIFTNAAATAKTITIRVPNVTAYTAAGTPWSDKIGANSPGYFWDNTTATRGNLTVALAAIGG